MRNGLLVTDVRRKLVIVKGQRFLCDCVKLSEEEAIVRGENIDTGEKTEWITVDDPMNAAFRFGDYMSEKL